MASLDSLEACEAFARNQPPQAIADQLRKDQAACRDFSNQGTPSLLVYCLPAQSDAIARAISSDDDRIPLSIARLRLSGIVQLIKSHLSQSAQRTQYPDHVVPTKNEFRVALKVLRYLQLPKSNVPIPSATFDQISEHIHHHISNGALSLSQNSNDAVVASRKPRNCYICHFRLARSSHSLYPSLCESCGEFNIACSSQSLHLNLDLRGRTAFVTGGRVNLGFHTALRLLRSGARVVISSRYPLDAHRRYSQEQDAEGWMDRLKFVGADFRDVKDVFELFTAVVQCLTDWAQLQDSDSSSDSSSSDSESSSESCGPVSPLGPRSRRGIAKLDILINNAAQTWTDSIDQETELIEQERQLLDKWGPDGPPRSILASSYVPRIRGGVNRLEFGQSQTQKPIHHQSTKLDSDPETLISLPKPKTESKNKEEISITNEETKCSWMQRLSEIPYEDVIFTHSVNAFAPFILLREFLPYLRRVSPLKPSNCTASKANGYVINVSAREGIFESGSCGLNPRHQKSGGCHTHTNMAKAALNMLTESEAGQAWRVWKQDSGHDGQAVEGRVAINTVDPGYLSVHPQVLQTRVVKGDEEYPCPIGWEDGAGRVLYPIAKAELSKDGDVPRGRFFKHFKEIAQSHRGATMH